ncbi:GNAT family N-acetyltransferase [Nisaea nitritireducens]|uniref:GNAT family N-acetyltransferase n=1 Tax=Nisaea nitritireducens TaxID=568392 RepID=UPI001866A90A|nr:GNAT family N-acetyltransferase [Nisaea nitritireducens]
MTEPGGYRLERDIEAYLDEASALHGAIFDRPWSRDALQDLLVMSGTDGAVILSGAREPAFAGFVLFQCIGDFAEILTLAVLPDHRGRGLGRILMQQALECARDTGAAKLLLEVQDGNLPAIQLYESLGMTAFDRRRNYYRTADGSHADAILMQLFFDN